MYNCLNRMCNNDENIICVRTMLVIDARRL